MRATWRRQCSRSNPRIDAEELDPRAKAAQSALTRPPATLKSRLAAAATTSKTSLRNAIIESRPLRHSRLGVAVPGSRPERPAGARRHRGQRGRAPCRARQGSAPTPLECLQADLRRRLSRAAAVHPGGCDRARPIARRERDAAGRHRRSRCTRGSSRCSACASRCRVSARCLHAAEAAGTGARMTLAVAQLPHVDGDRWIGLPARARRARCPPGGSRSSCTPRPRSI